MGCGSRPPSGVDLQSSFRPPCKGTRWIWAGGLAAHSSSVFFICILRRQVGLRIQPPCQKLSWIDHWGLRLQSSLLANWVAVTCLNQLGALSLLPLVVGTTRGGAEHCLPPPPVGSLITCMLLQSCKALSQQKSPPSGKLRYYRFFVTTTSLISFPKPL